MPQDAISKLNIDRESNSVQDYANARTIHCHSEQNLENDIIEEPIEDNDDKYNTKIKQI